MRKQKELEVFCYGPLGDGDNDCDEDDDDEYRQSMSACESRADAAEIARLAALANAGGTTRPVTSPSVILTSATTRGGITLAMLCIM